jgi:hypothetical protein
MATNRDGALGGTFNPTTDYDRTGATDRGGVYVSSTLAAPVILGATMTGTTTIGAGLTLTTPNIGAATGTSLALAGTITGYNGIATAGNGVSAIRAAAHLVGQTAAVASVATYTAPVDTTLIVDVSILVTTSSGENFTVAMSYTDSNGTPRVATLPLRLLTGVNVLVVNFANGAIPYAGASQQFRVTGGTAATVSTQGTFTGCTYRISANIKEV